MCTEPVEDGVILPTLPGEQLAEERDWLQKEITNWLDTEWEQGSPQPIHSEIGQRAAQIYYRLRMEGENDLTSILFALGGGLETMDFSRAFVGPWNVANKVSELLLLQKYEMENVPFPEYVPDTNNVRWSYRPGTNRSDKHDLHEQRAPSAEQEPERPILPSLADQFERYMFLKHLLEGAIEKNVSTVDRASQKPSLLA